MRLATITLIASFAIATAIFGFAQKSSAEVFSQGPKVCAECHRGESEVWQATKHAESFKTVHKEKKAKEIATATGEKSMKRNETCVQCHYTVTQKETGGKAKPEAGPSCESCHGASSDWFPLHNDYGGPSVKADQETPEHKTGRIASAAAAGMRWPSDKYGVAENCMECHGLANPNVAGDKLAIMLDSGHPTVADWELVRYSQGSVRHRFYPPDMTKNAEMSAAQSAEMYVIGQAAKLVSAVNAAGRSDSAKYKEFQAARAAAAREALGKVSAAAGLLTNPTADEARALVAAIQGKDLSGEVGGLLPAKDSYK
ncbi:MAG: cytochrome c family protein [Proteobacteria bacterium]|nr:cytochrome c family protein [Pseudomonadota bacterium]MDA1357810.1 cytochrome c family protein [Pseudomonadota bacterium]